MTVPTLLLLGLLSGGLALSAMTFVRCLRESSISSFRIELWRLHDEMVDAITGQRYADEAKARQLLDTVRSTIAHAPDFTAFQVFGAYAILRKNRVALREARRAHTVLEADLQSDELLAVQRAKFVAAATHAVFRTTLFGRVWLVILPVIFTMRRLADHRSPHRSPAAEALATQPIKAELRLEQFFDSVAATAPGSKELVGAAC